MAGAEHCCHLLIQVLRRLLYRHLFIQNEPKKYIEEGGERTYQHNKYMCEAIKVRVRVLTIVLGGWVAGHVRAWSVRWRWGWWGDRNTAALLHTSGSAASSWGAHRLRRGRGSGSGVRCANRIDGRRRHHFLRRQYCRGQGSLWWLTDWGRFVWGWWWCLFGRNLCCLKRLTN
jgi:hypothetical protein